MGRKPNLVKKDVMSRLIPGEAYRLRKIDGEEEVLWVKPVPFGKLRLFSSALLSLTNKVQEAGISDIREPASWPVIFDLAFEEVLDVMSMVLEKDKDWFDTILPASGVELIGIIINQNLTEDLKKKVVDLAARMVPPTSET